MSDFIVEIVGNATFSPKATAVPTFDKIIEGEKICEHEWTETEVIDPTCTDDGERKFVCDICGEEKTETIPATGHDFEDGICKDCGASEYQIVTFEELVTESEFSNKIALVTDGLDYVEVNEQNIAADDFSIEGVEISPLPSDGDGGKEYVLFKGEVGDYEIGATATDSIPAVIPVDMVIDDTKAHTHKWQETIVKEPTCEEDGEKKIECTECGEARTEVIPAAGHNYGDDDTCKECGKTRHDHDYKDLISEKEPTCGDYGEKTYECECGETWTEYLPATGNHVDDDGNCICDVCNAPVHVYEGVKYVPSQRYGGACLGITSTTQSYSNNADNYSTTFTFSKWTNTGIEESGRYNFHIYIPVDGVYTITATIPNGIWSVVDTYDNSTFSAGTSTKFMKAGEHWCDAYFSSSGTKGEKSYCTIKVNAITKLECSQCGLDKETAESHIDADMDCICDDCGIELHAYRPVTGPVPTVSLVSNSGAAVAKVSTSDKYAQYYYTLTGANVSGGATYEINIPKEGYYHFQDVTRTVGGANSTGVGTSNFSECVWTVIFDGKTLDRVAMLGHTEMYLTQGSHTLELNISHVNVNSDTHTNYTRNIYPVPMDTCFKCGHVKGRTGGAIYAMADLSQEAADTSNLLAMNLLPVSMAEEGEDGDAADEDEENNTDIVDDSEISVSAYDEDTTVKYGIGDSVPFRLNAVMPDSISVYDTYKLVFHDEMSAGLTYDEGSLKVFAGDVEIGAENYSVAFNGQAFTVTINDIIAEPYNAVAGTEISVRYTATLNDSAAFKNLNDAYLEYSNNPNGSGLGRTVSDEVTAFTFTVKVDKIDGKTGNELNGAGFTLYKKNGDGGSYSVIRDEVKGGTAFTFGGLGAGDYKLVESTTPNGYNTMEDLEFTIVADSREDANGIAYLTVLKVVAQGSELDGEMLEGWSAYMDSGLLNSNIANYKGSSLPSTGGIGTMMFYAVGGMIVLAVGFMLIRKRKEQAA